MNRYWSLALVVAFALGYGTKLFVESDQTLTTSSDPKASAALFQNHDNQTLDLFDQTDPRTRIVYFGFTHCPDVCPTSLAMLSAALKQLDTEQRASIRPIFITLDPDRDIAAKAHQYAQYFHPSIEGLAAPIETTRPLAEKYGVVFKRTELKDSQLEYTIDHNSYFYLLEPNGELITKVPHTLNPAPIITAIEQLNK